MEILTNYKQISDKVQNIFGVDVSNVPILDTMSKADILKLVQNAQVNTDTRAVANFAELIFQLNEYVPAVCNLIKMFLAVKHYTGVVTFMEKLFVAHVGSSIYNSKNKEYSHRERFFDRFIEVIKNTDLTLADYLPFLFAIVEDDDATVLSVWLAPCLEYLQNIFRENMDEVKEYVDSDSSHKNTYYTLGLEFNTQKAIRAMEAMAVGLMETLDEEIINQGPIFIEYLVKELSDYGVPMVKPAGGLGAHINASEFLPNIPHEQYPAGALATALYIAGGIRGMERGSLSEQRNPDGSENYAELELVRLACPRRVFTLSQVKYCADRVKWLYDNRELIGGLKWVEEPEVLRFFFGRLQPLSDWQEKLAAKFREDFGDSL